MASVYLYQDVSIPTPLRISSESVTGLGFYVSYKNIGNKLDTQPVIKACSQNATEPNLMMLVIAWNNYKDSDGLDPLCPKTGANCESLLHLQVDFSKILTIIVHRVSHNLRPTGQMKLGGLWAPDVGHRIAPHNPEVVGSNPTPATSVEPQTVRPAVFR